MSREKDKRVSTESRQQKTENGQNSVEQDRIAVIRDLTEENSALRDQMVSPDAAHVHCQMMNIEQETKPRHLQRLFDLAEKHLVFGAPQPENETEVRELFMLLRQTAAEAEGVLIEIQKQVHGQYPPIVMLQDRIVHYGGGSSTTLREGSIISIDSHGEQKYLGILKQLPPNTFERYFGPTKPRL